MNDSALPPGTAEILARFDRSSPDALLRSIAVELAQLQQSHTRLLARLAASEALTAFHDRIVAGEVAEIGAVYPARIRVESDQSFREGLGFHSLEHDIRGRPYRWTGPEREFSFQLFVDRRLPSAFKLCFDELYVKAPVEELKSYVDGRLTALTATRIDDYWRVSGILPPRGDRGGTVIAFVVPKVEAPQARGEADPRRLGMRFRWLEVEPEGATIQA